MAKAIRKKPAMRKGKVTHRARPRALKLYPPMNQYEIYTKEPSEIVVGIVGPLGTDNDKISRMMSERLAAYGYMAETIKLSKVIIPALAGVENVTGGSGYERAKVLIDLGNQIRRQSRNDAVLAIASAAEIARRRPDPRGKTQRRAYIVSSLKLPAEVGELRKIYGGAFYLFAVDSDKGRRLHQLMTNKEMSMAQAAELITRDEHEVEHYGQDTRNTFHLADFFLADENNDDKLRHSVCRCLDLIFGCPTITPTFNEFAMFMAFAASLRSADLARQVGAVISRGNEILSTGANDCPRAGGGLYWPVFIGDRVDDLPRGRDYKRGYDSNVAEKERLVDAIVKRFPMEQRQLARRSLRDSGIRDITEYGRSVHAEMEALLACARNCLTCVGATLYCTTFPCHNCAKHIIAAGIEQVIYIEPYPKSKAMELHDDAATTEKLENAESKVRFKPFIGVGPRQFFDLFSLSLSSGRPLERKTPNGKVNPWRMETVTPRVQMLPVAHRQFETAAIAYVKALKGKEA